MFKKGLSYIFLCLVLTSALVSCSAVDQSDPKSVLKAFFEKISKKDIDGAMSLATSSSQTTLGLLKLAVNAAQDVQTDEKNDFTKEFKDVTLGEPKIDGDKATVSLTSTKEQRSIDFLLKKEGGAWKVDFSVETLMKMGIQGRAQDRERNDSDSLTIDQFDNETLQRASEQADSILKNIDPKKLEELHKEGKALLEKYKENK